MRGIAKPRELSKLEQKTPLRQKEPVEDTHALLMGQNLEEERANKFYDMSWSLRGGLPVDRIVGSIAFEKKTIIRSYR